MKKEKRGKKRFVPIGIFLLLFTIESIVASAACLAYFVYGARSKIHDIEQYTRNYSITLAEALASVSELCYHKKEFSRLRSLFREKIQENIIDEAFFVLENGKLVAHSDREIEKSLKGNIANDELSYNMELIMQQVRKKSIDVNFSNYNIISRPMPFARDYRVLIKEYIYPEIETTGWLVSRAIFYHKRPVGTVNLIISKDRIVSFLIDHQEESLRFLVIAEMGAFALSFFISIIIFIRYRRIQKSSLSSSDIGVSPRDNIAVVPTVISPQNVGNGIITVDLLTESDDEVISMDLDSLSGRAGDESDSEKRKKIRDAIPINNEE